MDAGGCSGFLVLGTYNLVSRDSFVTFLWLVVSSLANIGVYIYIHIYIYSLHLFAKSQALIRKSFQLQMGLHLEHLNDTFIIVAPPNQSIRQCLTDRHCHREIS